MKLPKIIYEVPSLENQLSLFTYFLNLPEEFHQKIFTAYPRLKTDDSNDVIPEIYLQKLKSLEQIKQNIQKDWDNVSDSILTEFSTILEKEWNMENVTGGISLVPFSTRDLQKKRFDIFYKKDSRDILKTSIHEIFHFLYFEKWKEIFPNTTIEECDYPNPTWILSEIALPIMLNSSKVINDLGMNFKNYTLFEKEIFQGENVMEHITRIYPKNSISDFLMESNTYIKRCDMKKRNSKQRVY